MHMCLEYTKSSESSVIRQQPQIGRIYIIIHTYTHTYIYIYMLFQVIPFITIKALYKSILRGKFIQNRHI